jgi:hypothetical protein
MAQETTRDDKEGFALLRGLLGEFDPAVKALAQGGRVQRSATVCEARTSSHIHTTKKERDGTRGKHSNKTATQIVQKTEVTGQQMCKRGHKLETAVAGGCRGQKTFCINGVLCNTVQW